MAEMTKAEIEQIIKDYLSTRQIELKDFTTISGVDGTTYVLLVQPTGTANKMDVNLLKKQLVAEIKEPADLVINEVKEAGKEAALVVEAATRAVSDANTAATNADEAARVAEQAAENVKDGKTPVFGNVTAKDGDKAAATYTLNGVDANGNPKYDVDFTLPKGADGKHPVLQSGNITTLAPNEQVQASFRANGYDTESRPIYLVDLAIPQGQTGKAGDGSGNVLINPASLKKDARYLFSPKADGSAEGAFVEYVEPVIGGRNLILDSLNKIVFESNNEAKYPIQDELVSGENYRRFRRTYPEGVTDNIINTFTSEFFTPEKSGYYTYSTYFRPNEFDIELRLRLTWSVYGDLTLCKANEWTQVSVTAYIEAGIETRLFGVYGVMPPEAVQWIDYNRVSVTSGNKATDWTPAPEDIQAEIEKQITSKGYQTASDVKSAIDAVEIGGRNLIVKSKIKRNFYYAISGALTNGANSWVSELIGVKANEMYTATRFNKEDESYMCRVVFFDKDKNFVSRSELSSKHVFMVESTIGFISYQTDSFGGTYKNDAKLERGNMSTDWSPAPEDYTSFAEGANSITTLTNIPTDKRTILATLSAATNITLKERLEVGKELLISINPTVDFDQPLPVSNGWTSLDGDTLSLKANKPAELSILCVGDSKYVLSSKVAE